MISKSCDVRDQDWDWNLLYLLFAYKASIQEFIRKSPFYLVYGRDPRIPTETVLNYCRNLYLGDEDNYKKELSLNLSQA